MMNIIKLEVFLEKIGLTNLKQKLQSVHVFEKWFPKEKLQKMLDDRGFSVCVTSSIEEPLPIK